MVWKSLAFICVLVLLVGCQNTGQATLPPPAQGNIVHAASPNLPAVARGVPQGGLFVVENLQLEGVGNVRLDLKRFDVFTDDVQIVIDERPTSVRPTAIYFKGIVNDDPNSIAVLRVSPDGAVGGNILRQGELWELSRNNGAVTSAPVAYEDLPLPLEKDTLVAPDSNENFTIIEPMMASNIEYEARIAVETDYEFYEAMGSTQAALDFIGDAFAFASTVYETEANTRLSVTYISLWTEGPESDPWDDTTLDREEDFAAFWRANRQNVSRTLAHMIVGRANYCGVAWIDVLCNTRYGYGYTHELCIPGRYSLIHELGHNFGSLHTSEYCGVAGNPEPVDTCTPQEKGKCKREASMPAGCPGPGEACVTVMGYTSGCAATRSFSLGRNFPYGNEPDRVPDLIYTNTIEAAQQYPGCLDVTTCGNGVLDPGEECDGTLIGNATCGTCTGGTPTCIACQLDYTSCYDGFCDIAGGETCAGCAGDCVGSALPTCGNGICEIDVGEDCTTCAADCDGSQSGNPSTRWCCGNGGSNPVACNDARCSDEPGESCIGSITYCCGDGICEVGEPDPACSVSECSSVCGDGTCDPNETPQTCPADCGSSYCGDGTCDPGEDETTCPADCGSGGSCVNPGGAEKGASCSADSECCSNKCTGKQDSQTCK